MSNKIKKIILNTDFIIGSYVNTITSNNGNNGNLSSNRNNRICSTDINNTASKLSYLDYTFLSHKNALSLNSSLCFNNKRTEDYLFDLNKTLELNLELLTQIFNSKFKNDELNQMFQNMKKKIKEKKMKKKEVIDLGSKVLIDKQIAEEKKRKIEENNEYYQEKIIESETNSSNKNEYIKIVEKKLYEVEIYIQKNTKNLNHTKYDKYKNWKLRNFLDENISEIRRKGFLIKEKAQLQEMINETRKENEDIINEYKRDDEAISQIRNKNEKKIKECMNKYKKEIYIIGNRMKMLKSHLKELTNKYKYLSTINENQKLESKKTKEEINLNINNSMSQETNINNNNVSVNKDTSTLPHDMTRKLNNFMDFSLILNKKEESKIDELMKTGIGGNPFANLSNTNIWDISVINKN
jgi:hypothetical protein